MAELVKMPKLSDTMTDGVIAKWHKKVGDTVKSGELLAEIETDKATMDFESFQDGVLLHIGVAEKGRVPVDALIAILGQKGEDITALLNTAVEHPQNNNQNVPIETVPQADTKISLPKGVEIVRMPKLSDTMTDGTLSKWHKKVGDHVKSGELLADIQTDKATMEFESFQDGVLIYQGVSEGASVPVDALLAILGNGSEDVNALLKQISTTQINATVQVATSTVSSDNKIKEVKKQAYTTDINPSTGRLKASPLAKVLAKERGIDLKNIRGSGEGGRIIRTDVLQYKGQGSADLRKESFTDEPVSSMRRTIAKRLLESKNGAPHYYLTIEVDMDASIQARTAINAIQETKISYNDMVIKASAMALRKHPKVNVSWMGDTIRQYNHIHIGMAVAVEDGLLVPIIRFTDTKSYTDIAVESKTLGKKAKEKKLQPSDWEGNTFTISNLGMFGIHSFTSIINSPESCILSVGAIRDVPVVKQAQIVPGHIMTLTLACDHRTVDGATGAAFLQTLKQYLEQPLTMFI
ncbi:MAG: pyruvate dehydrogenase [Sphingobacteriia bacterium]|nr:pyruvate dehydrogenase [Sphingobacteriia bacterium]